MRDWIVLRNSGETLAKATRFDEIAEAFDEMESGTPDEEEAAIEATPQG